MAQANNSSQEKAPSPGEAPVGAFGSLGTASPGKHKDWDTPGIPKGMAKPKLMDLSFSHATESQTSQILEAGQKEIFRNVLDEQLGRCPDFPNKFGAFPQFRENQTCSL